MQKIGNIPNTRADNNGEFTDGNVAGGVPPTILPAEWFNTIQRELISVLSAAGITPDSNKFDQVSKAVSKLITDGGFLKTANNLSEIKTAGPDAVAHTLSNLGLGDLGTASRRNVGTGANQIPDMSSFASSVMSAGYQKLPGGMVLQWGEVSGVTGNLAAGYPIAFPNNVFQVVVTLNDKSAGSLGGITQYVPRTTLTKTQFVVQMAGSDLQGTVTGSYIAIGN